MTPGPAPLGASVRGRDQGSTLLFLHGFMGSGAEWTDVGDALEHGFRCVAVDLPGHGASRGLPETTYTIEGTAEAVLTTLDALGVERPVIAGYSMGGRLALYLALRHPDRCAGLFLESASPGLKGASERAERRKADEDKARRLERGDLEGFLHDWYRQPLFAPLARDAALLRRTVEARRGNDPAELARSLRGMGTGSQPSLWDELPNLGVPVCLVAGALDEKFVAISRRMQPAIPHARAVVVPDTGHNVRAEAPAEYLALLRGFLSDL